jgi:hypothetical protein
MSTTPIDYDAIAKKHGAIASVAPAGDVDYDAIAAKHGAVSNQVVPQEQLDQIQALNQNPTQFEKDRQGGGFKQFVSDFVNRPLIPYFAQKRDEAAASEQQQLNQIHGPEAEKEFSGVPKPLVTPLKQVRQLGTLPTSAARVTYGAGAMSPMDASVLAASTVSGQPELAAGYFAAKSTAEAPKIIKNAVQNPSPDNVEAALGTGATIAGGMSGLRSGAATDRAAGVPTVEEAGSTVAKNTKQLNDVGRLRQTARKFTQVESAIKDKVSRTADLQGKLTDRTNIKNQGAIEKHAQAIKDTEIANRQAQDEYTLSTEEARQAAAQKNADALAAHQAEVGRIGQENQAAEQTLGLRQKTEAELAGKTQEYYAKENAAEKAADEANQANWTAWRQKVADVEEDMTPVKATIERVTAKFPEAKAILDESTATPEDMTSANAQFVADRNSFMVNQGYKTSYESLPPEARAQVDAAMDRLGLKPDENVALDTSKPMSVQRIHDLKTQIGWKIFRNEYPGPILGAMKQVYKSLRQAEARGTLKAGAVPEYEAGLQSHQQYEQAFGRSKPSRSLEGELRKKEANPEAYDQQQEQERLAAAGKVEPSLPSAYQEVVGLRQKVKALPTEEQLRKGIKQPPEPPVPVEAKLPEPPTPVERPANPVMSKPKQLGVDLQTVARKQIMDKAKNWGNMNARDIGILTSSVLLTPLAYFLGEAVGHGGGASALAPLAAGLYEGGKYAASRVLNNPSVQNWLIKTPPEEVQALNRIPGADKIKVQDGLTNIIVESGRQGKPVTVSPELQQFLGPENVARITAATGSGVKTAATTGDLRKKAKSLVQK